ncbi:MAG: M20/M25/M40 family metallo-hydrolase [Acidobacteria bacterium]|nr:M20/M25/M40 family metallo-hydrolase [Acidobacteriota bacterium]
MADLPDVDIASVLADIRQLSSADFGGRAPGSAGEQRTVDYLVRRFQEAGAAPGHPDGGWVQHVPLVSLRAHTFTDLVVAFDDHRERFQPHEEVVAFSRRVTDDITVNDSEIVFVGYGVQASEYGWDDFKGVDVRGKTIVVLVNDPPVPLDPSKPDELDPAMFTGRAMTYYGRWTYKCEKAAELGAAAVLIVHETGPAGYPFTVVQGMDGERFDLVTPDRNMRRAAIEGWLSRDAAVRLLARAGLDFDELKSRARTREFAPVALGGRASMSFRQTLRTVDSRNVIAKIPGGDPAVADEHVLYVAHWDHLGTSETPRGTAVHHGARDNASGVAMLIEFARRFARISPRPRRTILLLVVTAEESGLLGSGYYATFPLYPLETTLAAINVDELNVWGRTRDVTVIGLGASDLDAYAAEAAAEQGRVLCADPEPEKGFYYRSDHFNFAKAGVPAFNPDSGVEFAGKPADHGQRVRAEWTEKYYHQPSDQVQDWWDLGGAAEDGKLLFALGYRVANAEAYPAWSAGREFRAVREQRLAAFRRSRDAAASRG